jgi:hypothetical protein
MQRRSFIGVKFVTKWLTFESRKKAVHGEFFTGGFFVGIFFVGKFFASDF